MITKLTHRTLRNVSRPPTLPHSSTREESIPVLEPKKPREQRRFQNPGRTVRGSDSERDGEKREWSERQTEGGISRRAAREEMRRNGVSSWGRIERPAGAVDGGESLGFPPAEQAREGSAIRSEDLRISSPVSRLSVARFEGFPWFYIWCIK